LKYTIIISNIVEEEWDRRAPRLKRLAGMLKRATSKFKNSIKIKRKRKKI
jgi:hypothetical protein